MDIPLFKGLLLLIFLILLLIFILEEFVSTKEDLPALRKNELKALITAQLNTITTQLAQILDSLFEQFTKKIEPKVPGGMYPIF